MLKISKNNFFEEKISTKEKKKSFGIFTNYYFFKMGSSNLINYWADMCWNCPCTILTWTPFWMW